MDNTFSRTAASIATDIFSPMAGALSAATRIDLPDVFSADRAFDTIGDIGKITDIAFANPFKDPFDVMEVSPPHRVATYG